MKASSGRAPAPAVAATASQSWLLNPLAGSRRENIESLMADDIETVRRVGLQRAYALIRGLEACRAFARLTPEERGLWEDRAEMRARAFCDGLAADLALMTPQDADPG